MTPTLPQELLAAICHFLPHRHDHFACLFVCRDWYTALLPLFYRSITLWSQLQLDRFHDAICTHQLALGCHVREIHIRIEGRYHDILEQLPIMCPSLQAIHLHIQSGRNDLPVDKRRQVSTIPKLIASHYRSVRLTQLTLMDDQGITGTDWLASLPHLTSLRIHWIRLGQWSIQNMDTIHDGCPNLTSLDIALRYTPTEMEEKHLMLQPTNTAPTMHRIHLYIPTSVLFDRHHVTWLAYIAAKYPNLQEIALETDQYPNHHINNTNRDSHHCIIKRQNAYSQLVSSCPKIKSVGLRNFRHFRQMMRALRSLPLEHLEVTQHPSQTDMLPLEDTVYACFETFSKTLQSLVLGRIATSASDHQHLFGVQLLFRLELPNLTRLDLQDLQDQIAVNLLLYCCPALESITFFRTHLMCSSNRNYHHPPNFPHVHLRHIGISSQNVSEDVISYLVWRCSRLLSLDIQSCVFSVPPQAANHLRIYLPRAELATITLNDLFISYSKENRYNYDHHDLHPPTLVAVRSEIDQLRKNYVHPEAGKDDYYWWYNVGQPDLHYHEDKMIGLRPLDRRPQLSIQEELYGEQANEFDNEPQEFVAVIHCRSIGQIIFGNQRLLKKKAC